MLTMTLDKLPFIDIIDNVEIHSFDASIYTVRLYIDGLEYRLVENNHKPYQRRLGHQEHHMDPRQVCEVNPHQSSQVEEDRLYLKPSNKCERAVNEHFN